MVTLAGLAMLAFAANSLLARLALVQTSIDATSFSVIRLLSGALFLFVFVVLRQQSLPVRYGSWMSALALFVYAIAFSFAYLQLSAGTGALILFGAVQVTMLGYGFVTGSRLTWVQWFGFCLACVGVVYLMSPGVSAPPLGGAGLMAIAGIAWAVYSLRAGGGDATATSAGNFLRTLPMCLLVIIIFSGSLQLDTAGVAYACISGAVTSGLGYVLWYRVLPLMSVTSAATIQLSVPAIAAIMGVVFIAEPVSMRLLLAALAILSGIALVLRAAPPVR